MKLIPNIQQIYTTFTVGKIEKLVPNLSEKGKYLHYSNLKLYLNLGLNLGKTHRMVKLDQSEWLKVYINKGIEWEKNRIRWWQNR